MNLAQLIDPEWVQDRFPERGARSARPIGAAPMPAPRTIIAEERKAAAAGAPVTRSGMQTGAKLRILSLLVDAPQPMTNHDIARRVDVHAVVLGAYLSKLVKERLIARRGRVRHFEYFIAAAGRAWLRAKRKAAA